MSEVHCLGGGAYKAAVLIVMKVSISVCVQVLYMVAMLVVMRIETRCFSQGRYRGTSLIRNCLTHPMVVLWGGQFLMSEVPRYGSHTNMVRVWRPLVFVPVQGLLEVKVTQYKVTHWTLRCGR
jgi:hypothetical protein